MLLTSFVKDDYYRSANQGLNELKELINRLDPEFVAKAAVFARQEFGMRSISHAAAALVAKRASGKPWSRRFYSSVIRRPDDMTEIVSFYKVNRGKSLPAAMKVGFANALGKFNEYQLAKYRGEGNEFKLVDLVNLVRPKPTDANAEALNKLVAGTLVSTDTWESELTRAGQNAKSEVEKTQLKSDVWVRLISERKLGYFALLRNLRNIVEQAPTAVNSALEMLVDESLIKKSLVLPFRFSTAYDVVKDLQPQLTARVVMAAISDALDISCNNVPELPGRTLVCVDDSGSMSGEPLAIASLFAAVIAKKSNADVIRFSDNASWVNYDPGNTALSIAEVIRKNARAAGTNFHAPFQLLMPHTRVYDRIIFLSDMQGWMGYDAPTKDLCEYKRVSGANPFIHSFNVKGYGTLMFPEHGERICCITGFSEKALEMLKAVEEGRDVLVKKIEAYQI
jgi:hypothetical protein